MAKIQQTAAATIASGLATGLEPQDSRTKHRVVCCGMTGKLALRGGRWVLDNEAELAVLEALGGSSVGVGQLQAITAALNSRAAGVGNLTNLNRCLRSIAETEPVWAAGIYEDLMAATAVACAHWDHPKAIQWLCWALSTRLGHNLSKSGLNGPGRLSFHYRSRSPRICGHDRNTAWLRRVGDGFWDCLAVHKEAVVRDVAEASDPATPASRLEELGKSLHEEVLDLVASHPNTSENTLLSLFFHNPKNVRTQDRALRFRVAQNLALSPQFIALLADEPSEDSVWWLLIHHPNTKESTLERIADNPRNSVIAWVASNPRTPRSALESLVGNSLEEQHDEIPAWKIRKAAAANPALPAYLLAKLARDRRRMVRAAAASNPSLASAMLEKLASDRCAMVRAAAASNPEMPQRMLSQLASDAHPRVRWALAAREHTPEVVQDMLAADPNFPVRLFSARNPSASKNALARLAGDSEVDVRWEVANNTSTRAEELGHLAGDVNAGVRASVANHPSAPASVLDRLASDTESWVRASVANHPSASTDVLTALASDPELRVRSSVAGNPSAPMGLLEQLAGENHPLVLEQVAGNPSTPDSAMERLSKREWASVFHPAQEALTERQQAENHCR